MPRKLDSASEAEHLIARLARLQPTTRALWGKMNAHQMVCHLTDAFKGVAGHKPVTHEVTLIGRTLMRFGAFHLPFKWPQGIPTRPEMAQEIGGTPPAEWAADIAELRARLSGFPTVTRFEQHPMMGPLSLNEWRIWGFRHVDHHFRQFGI